MVHGVTKSIRLPPIVGGSKGGDMAIIVKDHGLDSEAVVGSLCLGYLEVEGRRLRLSDLKAIEAMGYTVLYVQ